MKQRNCVVYIEPNGKGIGGGEGRGCSLRVCALWRWNEMG